MTYSEAFSLAIVKKIVGWLIVIPAFISTCISLLNYLLNFSRTNPSLDVVLADFLHIMIEMIRVNTGFLSLFWSYSPVPGSTSTATLSFWIVYFLVFVGAAFNQSGNRIWRQAIFIRENIEDQLLLEQIKDEHKLTKDQLKSRIKLANHPLYKQILTLYFSPIIIGVLGYISFSLLGFIR